MQVIMEFSLRLPLSDENATLCLFMYLQLLAKVNVRLGVDKLLQWYWLDGRTGLWKLPSKVGKDHLLYAYR